MQRLRLLPQSTIPSSRHLSSLERKDQILDDATQHAKHPTPREAQPVHRESHPTPRETAAYQDCLAQAVKTLREGGLVIYPTETCYGIGADATNQSAIDRLLKYKHKRHDKPLSIAVADERMAEMYVELNDQARRAYTHYLPGPVTVVSNSRGLLANGVASSLGTQGVRIPAYPFVIDMVRALDKPITATSANASYKKTPYSIDDVLAHTSKRQQELVALAIDAGTLPKRKPSTVIDTTLDAVYIMRKGNIDIPGQRAYLSHSLLDTDRFAQQLLQELEHAIGTRPVYFLLNGDLGAGKTHLTKSIAHAVGITDLITSPTYTLCHEYRLSNTAMLYHIDAYRLQHADDVHDLGLSHALKGPNIFVIEWADRIRSALKTTLATAVVVDVHIEVINSTTRRFAYTISDVLS